MSKQKILIADDEERLRRLLSVLLSNIGYDLILAEDGQDALEKVEADPPSLVITDLRMPRMDGLELLKNLKETRPDIPVLVITAYGSIDSAVEAMKAGAVDYIQKPFEEERIKLAIHKALELRKILSENIYLRSEQQRLYDFGTIIAESEEMKQAIRLAEQVAVSNTTVLILGESGTGKELMARAIHLNSDRSRGPFVAINCAALPENLLESELFGYERGAFTGAAERKKGRFELADGGTLLLDEIARMALPLQAKILRVVQEKEFDRLGGTKTVQADVRIVAATNQDLREHIKEERFLEDLYFRISVFPITIPPLRERRDDIMPLIRFFLERFCGEMGKPVPVISPEAETVLLNYQWNGNVRELQNYIERAVILLRDNTLTPDLLPPNMMGADAAEEKDREAIYNLPPQGVSLEGLEKSLLEQALAKANGNKTAAARFLGLTRATLRYRLEKHGLIDPSAKKDEAE